MITTLVPREDLKGILEDSFKEFRHKDVVAGALATALHLN
jgi:hypothetical protein